MSIISRLVGKFDSASRLSMWEQHDTRLGKQKMRIAVDVVMGLFVGCIIVDSSQSD